MFSGVFRNVLWVLDYNGNGQRDGTITDRAMWLGQIRDVPVVGDWNGVGSSDKAGIFRNGLWVLDYNGNGLWDGTLTDRALWLGQTSDVPVVGTWSGTGISSTGLVQPNQTQ
jgi:hypothetical protein